MINQFRDLHRDLATGTIRWTPNDMGVIFSVSSWLVVLAFSLYNVITSVPIRSVAIMLTFITLGLFLCLALFLNRKNQLGVVLICFISMAGLLFASRFPMVGPYLNVFLCSIAVYPVILLEQRSLAIMLTNLIICVLVLTWTELYQNVGTVIEITEQIFSFLVKFTLLLFSFGQAYAVRVIFHKRSSGEKNSLL